MPAHGAAFFSRRGPWCRRSVQTTKSNSSTKTSWPASICRTDAERSVGAARAALGIKGVLGKALGATFSPLAVAATLPMSVAAQRSGGTDWEDIATDPSNWFGPAFAASGADLATKGMKSTGILAKAIRMGMSPGALRMGSRFLGLPGLALTGGMWAYDKWKGKDKDDEFKVRTYKDDDD